MSTGTQVSLARRLGTMWLLISIEVVNLASKLFTFSLPVFILAGIAGGPTPMVLCTVAIIGWAADLGGAIARDVYDGNHPATADRDHDGGTHAPSGRRLISFIVYSALTIGIAAAVGTAVLTISRPGAVVAAAITAPALDRARNVVWYLNPATIPIEAANRAAGEASLVLEGDLLSTLSTDDIRSALLRHH
jgi:hypothetical protein